MSELIQQNDNRATIRWKLLTGASAMALTAYVVSTTMARADDADRPTIWLELGGQMDIMSGTSTPFTAPFFTYPTLPITNGTPNNTVYKASKSSIYGSESFKQKAAAPRFALGGDAKITFQPEDSDWVFSAAVRYGRSHSNKHSHHQTTHDFTPGGLQSSSGVLRYIAAFSDLQSQHSERHNIIDFQAGKDVGLGLFGKDGESKISAGVRFASLTASSRVHISARPYVHFTHHAGQSALKYKDYFHQYYLTGQQARSFKGVGPSLSWKGSTGIAGNRQDGELALDWQITGAVLFGRQKAKTSHSTHASYHGPTAYGYYSGFTHLYTRNRNNPLRSRKVTVPNVSLLAGLSYRYTDAKLSIGYRYDTFFNAMDTGIDAAKKSNLTFNGPYASISIGLGD